MTPAVKIIRNSRGRACDAMVVALAGCTLPRILEVGGDTSSATEISSFRFDSRAYHGHTAGVYGHVTRGSGGQRWSPQVNEKPLQSLSFRRKSLERATRIELAFSAWEAEIDHMGVGVKALIRRNFLLDNPDGLR